MASKKSKAAAPTDDELNELLEGLNPAEKKASKPSKATKSATTSQVEQDLLAELDDLENLGAQPAPRPHTPRVAAASKRANPTPPPGASSRTSEDKQAVRESADSVRSTQNTFTPSATSSDAPEPDQRTPVAQPAVPVPAPAPAQAQSGGGWWGSVFATASAAVNTAQAAVKEIQQNEEAKRWAEQVKGNVGALRGLGVYCDLPPSLTGLISI
jgi:hypothetical protein